MHYERKLSNITSRRSNMGEGVFMHKAKGEKEGRGIECTVESGAGEGEIGKRRKGYKEGSVSDV